ncbi:MAG: ATP-binding protein [Chloroflexi bacterium]|nr:ATP-binding protein [Chloroflexota bacterium]
MAERADSPIGFVVGGGLRGGLHLRLNVPPSRLKEGAFVVARVPATETEPEWSFYGLITDLYLDATQQRLAREPASERFGETLARLLHGQTLFAMAEMTPVLMQSTAPPSDPTRASAWQEDASRKPMPVKSIPPHHTPVFLATQMDIDAIFGQPDAAGRFFTLGYTPEQGHAVRIDLAKFVRRPAGVFGATGAGKSFLTRLLMAGLIKYGQSSLLVFDMHNEYGFDIQDPDKDTRTRVIGLKSKFPAQVRVVALGPGTLIHGHHQPHYHLVIPTSAVQPEDILLLSRELNLRETTPTILDALVRDFGPEAWFRAFRDLEPGKRETIVDENGKERTVPAEDSVEGWARRNNIHEGAALALHSKLRRLFHRPYLVDDPAQDTLDILIRDLEEGRHIILSFGDYETDLDYLFVTNLLTRRIREHWVERTNQFRSKQGSEPRPLVVVVEEAHKLLNREMAAQTTFNILAREMRKYYVTLLIVDQRPSQIDDEVMSQLGTRISGWLGDEDDIRAVLAGLAGRDALRGMLARLQLGEEVLVMGYGVPMPIVLRSRRYDETFWKELLAEHEDPTRVTEALDVFDV